MYIKYEFYITAAGRRPDGGIMLYVVLYFCVVCIFSSFRSQKRIKTGIKPVLSALQSKKMGHNTQKRMSLFLASECNISPCHIWSKSVERFGSENVTNRYFIWVRSSQITLYDFTKIHSWKFNLEKYFSSFSEMNECF